MKDSAPKIIGSRFVLAVNNLDVSSHFYVEKMGMTSLWAGPGWNFLKRDNFVLMLGECPDDMPAHATQHHAYFAYIEVIDIDLLYREFKDKGVEIISAPEDRPWGQREFTIRTVDGHRIMFGEAILR